MTSFCASHGITGRNMCTRICPDCIPIFVCPICYTCPIWTKIKTTPQRLLCTRWRSCLRLQAARSRVPILDEAIPFFIESVLPVELWFELDLSSNRNECQRYLLDDKGSRCIRLTWPPSSSDCLENL